MPTPNELETPKRLTLSEIVRQLIARPAREHSGVTLTQTRTGETQIEVSVRTGDDTDVATIEEAETKAREVYDRLRDAYPHGNGGDASDNASVALTRNAKGETQIAMELKTGEGGPPTLELAAARAREVYDGLRMAYPMADGNSAKPGSVA